MPKSNYDHNHDDIANMVKVNDPADHWSVIEQTLGLDKFRTLNQFEREVS